MNKTLLSAFALTALVAAGGAAKADPAVLINPAGLCALADGNGNFVVTNDTRITATQSQNGNSVLQCQANVTPSSSGTAVHYDFKSTGALCGILNPLLGLQLTDDWHETVSASGQATLICQVHPN